MAGSAPRRRKAIAQAGATVVLLGRRVRQMEKLHDAIAAIAKAPVLYPLDLEGASPDDFAELAHRIDDAYGRLDGILHCAADFRGLTPLEHTEPAAFARAMHVNVTAPAWLTQACLPVLRKSNDASVVFVVDDLERVSQAYWGAYGLAQHARVGIGVDAACRTRELAHPRRRPATGPDAHGLAREGVRRRHGSRRARSRIRRAGVRRTAVADGRRVQRRNRAGRDGRTGMTIASAALLLFLILDPLGNIPVFLGLLKPLSPARRRVVLARELLIALVVLMLFLWGGKYALELMHLRQESVSIAGGIVLFLIGLRMIFPPPEGLMGDLQGGEPFIVPMAIPLVAGPSGMAAVMLMGSNEPTRLAEWSLALMIAWGATAAILFSATVVYKWLGTSVLIALERLMGMLLVAISVQMFLDGLGTYVTSTISPGA